MGNDSAKKTKKKSVVILILLVIFTIGCLSILLNGDLKSKILSNLQVSKVSDKADEVYRNVKYKIQKRLYSAKDVMQYDYRDKIALHFRDKSVMVGELIGITKEEYHIDWKGEETIVYIDMVDHITSPREALKQKPFLSDKEISEHWPYENDIVIRLKNRAVLDAKINQVGRDKVSLLHIAEAKGSIEQDIERSKIDYLIFKPIDNEESRDIESSLRELFPNMEFYREGNFTIVTDSYITWVKKCKKTLRKTYTDIYLEFFGLFKDKNPQFQNFVVIFDDYVDFVEYAVADGVPGWAVSGYFSPEDKVLYLFNVLGDTFSEILFEGMVGESGRRVDEIVDVIEGHVDSRHHIYIKGRAKKIKDKFWKVYNYYENMFRKSTLSTLRHEFTHEIFHNWGLQSISVSKFKGADEELIKKKKEFLETKDCKKKAELLRTLVMQRSQGMPLDMKAANSWLAEGTATYCETDEIGAQNDRWLFIYQEMTRKKPIYPLEFLTAYKIGSFPGVYSRAMLELYAQSWAVVSFLMKRYPKEFMGYQDKLAGETIKEAREAKDIEWLQEALGKDLRTIETEFVEYMDAFEELEDPFLTHFDTIYNTFRYEY